MQMRHLSLSWERRGRGAVKSKKKTILDDVSVKFPAGEVSAILGPSGAGKVSLSVVVILYCNFDLTSG
jgi:ABC-type multidrug transport system ATPase subunit